MADNNKPTDWGVWAGITLAALVPLAGGLFTYGALSTKVEELVTWRAQHEATAASERLARDAERSATALAIQHLDDELQHVIESEVESKAALTRISDQLQDLQAARRPK